MIKILLPLLLSAAQHTAAQTPTPATPQPLISHQETGKPARKPEMLRAGNQIKPLKALSVETGTSTAAAFTPYGDALVTAGGYGLKVWATANWTQFKAIPPQAATWGTLCFSPAGDQLAAGAADGTVTVWKLPDFTIHKPLADHKGGALACAFSPDGKYLATAGEDNIVYIYQEPDLAPVKSLIGKDDPVTTLLFSQDSSRLLAAGQGKAALWQVPEWQKIKEFSSHPGTQDNLHTGAFSSDGTFLAVFAGKEITIWRTDALDSPFLTIPLAEPLRSGLFSRDGRSLLGGDANGNLRVWTLPSGELLKVIADAHAGPVRAAALSPDGKILSTLGGEGEVKIWNAFTVLLAAGNAAGAGAPADVKPPATPMGKLTQAQPTPGAAPRFYQRNLLPLGAALGALALGLAVMLRRKKTAQPTQTQPAVLSPLAMQAFAKQTSPHLEIHTLETSLHQSGSINAVKVPTERYPIPEGAEDEYALEHGLTLPERTTPPAEDAAPEQPEQDAPAEAPATEEENPQADLQAAGAAIPEETAPEQPAQQIAARQEATEMPDAPAAPPQNEADGAPAAPPPPPAVPAEKPKQKEESGRLVAGRFKILRELGEGTTAHVFEARDITVPTAPRYALKRFVDEITPGIPDWEEFSILVKKLAKLRHPDIAGVENMETENGVYLVTALAPGMNLARHLKMYGKMSPFEAGGFAMHAARAIAHAHDNGFTHSDLKPSNIIVDTSGKAMVTDFEIALEAKLLLRMQTGKETTQTSEVYYSPQAHDQVFDKSGDIYSLGVILYEMIAGEPPFRGPGYLAQKIALQPKPLKEYAPAIPPAMEAAIMRCMAPLPDKRFPSAAELADVLQLALKP